MLKNFGLLKKYGPALALLVVLLIVWETASRLLRVPTYVLPPPSRIAGALWQWRGPLFLQHLPVTLWETLLGLVISIVLGVTLAAAMHLSPLVNRSLYPLVVASQTIPTIAIAPVFLFWFGFSLAEKVAVVVLYSIFPLAVNTFDGLRSADPDLLAWMQAAGARRWRTLRMVEVPAALPAFFTGLKVAATYSITGAVIGEWLGGDNGLGIFGRRAASALKAPELFASVLLLALLGIALFWLSAWAERRFTPHHAQGKEE
ncbi:MAG: ABC transporter permease [Firmicutes bacterium]|nr:ABC transporter permease [Bacillota bacterium]